MKAIKILKRCALPIICFLFAAPIMAQVKPNEQVLPNTTSANVRPVPGAYSNDVTVNSVYEWVPSMPILDRSEVVKPGKTVAEVKQNIQYLDGLGRPFQNVSRKAGFQGRDIVAPVEFDAMGRNTYSYLPYVSDSSNGSFQNTPFARQASFMSSIFNPFAEANGERFFYSKTEYEATPLGRTTKTLSPGNSWVGSNRGVSFSYATNGAAEVRLWSIGDTANALPISTNTYKAGELFKTITTDEKGIRSVEYKNKDGFVVLKKSEIAPGADVTSHNGWLCTYYIFDDLNVLRFVLQPKAVEIIAGNWEITSTVANELCFIYTYDERLRNVTKKVPGAGMVSMVYDVLDRLVMSQDSILRAAGKWQVLTYDAFSRPVKSYLWINSQTRSYHQEQAWASQSYPSLTGSTELLTETFYDNYSWTASAGVATTFDSSQVAAGFENASDISYPYARSIKPDYAVKGMVTGKKIKVLDGTGLYLYTTIFYDEKGRVIQTQSTNKTGGADVVTNQYSFDGKLLVSKREHNAVGMLPVKTIIIERNTYDNLGRLQATSQQVNNGAVKIISELSYDALGNLATKRLGRKPANASEPLEQLNYSYNIRGWLTGINKDYATGIASTNYFGMQLSYDFGFTSSEYNGNISGITWRGKSDGEQRAYGMSYDAVNRLLKADFTQKGVSGWDQSAGLNFNVIMGAEGTNASGAYDANGNIVQMQQWGWKGSTSALIDNLSYQYSNSGNKLASVSDNGVSTTGFNLDDFKNGANVDDDYSYDGNGNLLQDKNKSISSISYNYLNLPSVINVTGKGTISYIYDAAGSKLEKQVADAVTGITTTTLYLNGFVYEKKSNGGAGALQYFGHAEGRVRRQDTSHVYDYFIKDHLGNVRSVITEEVQTVYYPAATLEGSLSNPGDMVHVENGYYDIDPAKIVELTAGTSGIPEYVNNNNIPNPNPNEVSGAGTAVSAKMYKLNGVGAGKSGLGITTKVMAGDVINILGKSYWNTSSDGNDPAGLESILAGLLAGPAGIGAAHGINATELSALSANSLGIPSLLNSRTVNSGVPRAYINYIFFDEQFKYAGGGFSPVSTAGGYKDHYDDPMLQNIAVPKSGYIYVYCSNDSPVDVFFDNLQLVHTKGHLLEETHYYPFGLAMMGISSKAANGLENRYKFNAGTELSGDLDLDWYETAFRSYDPQIGRFHQIDALTDDYESWSPYQFAFNDPFFWNDPFGLENYSLNDIFGMIEDGSIPAGHYTSLGDGTFNFDPATYYYDKARQTLDIWVSASYGMANVTDADGVTSTIGAFKTGYHVSRYVPSEYRPYEESAVDFAPVVGEGLKAYDHFKKGRWGWGLFHAALAASDVFAVKALFTVAGKAVVKGAGLGFVALINRETKVYRIMENATGEVYKFGVASKPLLGKSRRLERQLAKLGSGYSGSYVATLSNRSLALDFERYLVTLYKYNGPTASRPIGNLLPAIDHWLW